MLGFVSATGIAGLTVGGGFGYLTRSHGWTCDTVCSMEVVTAEGQVVRAAADENPQLFWALRGGSGNFGIVTSFEYRIFPVGPEILGGAIAWRAEDAKEVLDFYMDDIMGTMTKNGYEQAEKNDVLAILYSLKGQVVRV